MSAEITAHDMSRFQRIFTVERGRVTGLFVALVVPKDRDLVMVTPYDVTVWADDAHTWGRTLVSRDFTAWVRGDTVDVPGHMITADKRDDIAAALSDFITAIQAVADRALEAMAVTQ